MIDLTGHPSLLRAALLLAAGLSLLMLLQWSDARALRDAEIERSRSASLSPHALMSGGADSPAGESASAVPERRPANLALALAAVSSSQLSVSAVDAFPLLVDRSSLAVEDVSAVASGSFAALRTALAGLLAEHRDAALVSVQVEPAAEQPGAVRARLAFRRYAASP